MIPGLDLCARDRLPRPPNPTTGERVTTRDGVGVAGVLNDRWRAVGGIAGPAAFVAAWSVLGHSRPRYSAVHDPISRLAAVDSPSRTAMTAGFIAFGVGVGVYAPALRRLLPGGTAMAAATTAAATIAVGLLPLGGRGGDRPHAIAATIAYAALAATPLLGSRELARRGHLESARASVASGVLVAVALAASTVTPTATGLAQRIGLTLGDAWIASTALAVLARRNPSHR